MSHAWAVTPAAWALPLRFRIAVMEASWQSLPAAHWEEKAFDCIGAHGTNIQIGITCRFLHVTRSVWFS